MSPLGKERLEGFQRALAATCRAIAHKPGLNVSFRAAEGRGLGRPAEPKGAGKRVTEPPGLQLPPPRRAMAAQDVARLRGEADGAALRLRHHNAKLHHRLAPHGEVAGAIFGALEQVRVEALGAQRMLGVAANLASAHAARQLDFGGVTINEAPTFRADQMPYGGVKDSGNTREGPAYAVREMTEERLVVLQL